MRLPEIAVRVFVPGPSRLRPWEGLLCWALGCSAARGPCSLAGCLSGLKVQGGLCAHGRVWGPLQDTGPGRKVRLRRWERWARAGTAVPRDPSSVPGAASQLLPVSRTPGGGAECLLPAPGNPGHSLGPIHSPAHRSELEEACPGGQPDLAGDAETHLGLWQVPVGTQGPPPGALVHEGVPSQAPERRPQGPPSTLCAERALSACS